MKTLIICVSESHGNTRQVADAMAEVLDATVVEPEQVDLATLGSYDLVGFGSGIYFMAVHPRLRSLLGRLPHVDRVPAFVFATSGSPELPLIGWTRPVKAKLAGAGYDVLDAFTCRGWDTVGPLRLIGGFNRGHPDDSDLDAAAAFARELHARVAPHKVPRSKAKPARSRAVRTPGAGSGRRGG